MTGYMVAAKNDGPVLPPMTPGLIHTPTDAIHNLFGAVFFQALNEGDLRWLNGLDYLLVADLAGIDRSLAERVRRMQLAGQIKPGAFAGFAPAKPPDFRRLGKVREQGTSTAGPVAPDFDSSKAHFRLTPSNGGGCGAMRRQNPRYMDC